MAKTWLRRVLVALILLTLLAAGTVFVVDPFQVYRPATLMKPLYENGTQAYMNAGLARNFDYDALIVGTSMTENFHPSLVDETFGVHSIKIPFGAGMANNFDQVLSVAFRTHDIRQVFYGLDMYSMVRDPGYSYFALPSYLYDRNPFNDVAYLLNGEVLFRRIPSMVKYNLMDSPLVHADRDSLYTWPADTQYGEQAVLGSYDFKTPAVDMLPAEAFDANVLTNFDQYIRPYLDAYPNTAFTFFFPPYSSLQWYMMMQQGHLDAILRVKESLTEWLLTYPNVRLYDFTANTEWIENFDLYKDYAHYGPTVNDGMTLEMAQDTFLVDEIYDVYEYNDLLYTLAESFPVPGQ